MVSKCIKVIIGRRMKTVLKDLYVCKVMRHCFCLLILGILCPSTRAQEPAHVIIVAGQSNTDGRVPVADLPEYIKSMGIDSTGLQKELINIVIFHRIVWMGSLFPFGLVVTVGAMMLSLITCWNSYIRKSSM